MASISIYCPKCENWSTAELPEGQTRASCPVCGAGLKLAAPVPPSGPPDGEGKTDEALPSKPAKPRRKNKTGAPAWAWAVLGLVLLAAGGLVTGIALSQRPNDPNPANAGPAPLGVVGAPPRADQPRPAGKVDPDLGIVGEKPVKIPGPRADAPATLADVIYLSPADTPTGPGMVSHSTFDRELVRQALWLSAREEFGLRTRDAALGESVPDGLPEDRQFRFREMPKGPDWWTLTVRRAGAEHQIWTGSFIDQYSIPEQIANWVARAETLSRGFDRLCLESAGFEPRPVRRSDAPVPPAAEDLLGRMREADQFAAVRLLHAEVREKGESDALLAALARGYANLGLLTEFHWSAAPMAFKARGLLYAQRLVVRSPRSPAAVRARAYAAALAGLHRMALMDLEGAAKLAVADPAAPPPPPWVEPLDAYLHFDPARLAAARKKADTPLVRLLQFLAADEPLTPAATITAGREFLRTDPECYRVHDSMCRTGGVSHLHSVTVIGPAVFAASVVSRVREQPGLPGPVADLLAGRVDEARLYEALRAAGTPATDRGEPSWAALGSLLRDVQFTQAVHRLDFMARVWGVPTGETARGAADVLQGHPLLPLIESYEADPLRDPGAVRRKLVAAPPREFGLKAMAYYHRLSPIDPGAAGAWFLTAVRQTERLYPDDARNVRGQHPDHVNRASVGGQLQKLSPHAPYAQALLAASAAGPQLAGIEKEYAAHAVVQRALGERHLAEGRLPDAARCWGRWLELSPDGQAYQKLAAAYLQNGQEEKWRETLETSLGVEDHGLEHAHVRTTLARHYMARKEFRKALPYAEAAAETGAGWALLCAAECEQALHHWGSANDYFRTAAERYENDVVFNWYFACRASGKMDGPAAERAVRDFLARVGGPLNPDLTFRAARFHLLIGDVRTASREFERVNAATPGGLVGLFTALTADAVGDGKARDRALAGLEKLPASDAVKPVGAILSVWATRDAPPDAAAVEAALQKLPVAVRADADLLVGWYLHNHGQTERATALWERCRDSEAGTSWLRTHARAFLEQSGKKAAPADEP